MPTHFLPVAFAFILYLFSYSSQAQILNIERQRIEKDTVNYFTGKAGLNFSMFNRNAGKSNPNNYLQLTFDGNIAYVSARNSYLLLNYYNYLLVNYDSREQRNTVASTGYSHFRTNFLYKKPLSYETFVQLQADKARGLELRTLAGGGLRYRLFQTKKSAVYLGAGIMHEHEAWESQQEDAELIRSDLIKSTNYLSLKSTLTEQVSTNAIVYYQTGYDKGLASFRNRISGDVTLQVKLTSKFSLRTNFNCTYEDEPIIPITRFVYAISNGVQVQF
ncbi:DUF481 domain-containing protein [Pontibacter sp. E15-1]|uniref:DUF481 domain-containing protein n=1 Tax=Pontibacter sp. E15-1 TaxID=2919918 RepID=UPI001F4FE372|nr:DUF481 domain-containing protein [Pontibacter sp. E15-1]MCJ8166322.1 DUF481 domain-containing protein [Pontibacter sp. E15-1]